MTASAGGTFRGISRWDIGTRPVPMTPEPITAAPLDPEAERGATQRTLYWAQPPSADPVLPMMLELVRAELVKVRLLLEQALKPRANGDDALDDIQRHWNVAAK